MLYDSNPLITIIVPVYNVAACLNSTLTSIVSQTYQNLEIILVDDGSTDSSSVLCDAWANKDSRIRVFHQQNQGPSYARNMALDHAAGEYILFSDSDDLLSPDLCQVLLDGMVPEANISMCDFVHIAPGQPYSFQITPEYTLEQAEVLIKKMWYQNGILPSACAKLYRRSVFASHRFTPRLIFEDIDLLHELFWTAEKIAYTPSRLYGYVHRAGSITTRPFSTKDMDILKVTERILKFAESRPALIRSAQAYAVTAALRIYLNAPETSEYADGISRAKDYLTHYGKSVLLDKNIRRKTRYALWLYFLCKPALRFVYKYINRWK